MKTVVRILICLTAVFWIWSGMLKLLAPEAFRAVVAAHGVVPEALVIPAVRGIPLAEVSLGLGFAWYFGHRAAITRTLGISLALITVFTGYLLMVPAEIVREAGCGCQGGAGVSHSFSDSVGVDVRTTAVTLNAALAAIHLLLMLFVRRYWNPPVSSLVPA